NGNVTIHTSGWEGEYSSDCVPGTSSPGFCANQAADDFLGCGSPITLSCGVAQPWMKNDNKICRIDVFHSIADNFGVGTHSTPEVRDHRAGAPCPDSDASLNYHIDELKKFTTDTVVGPGNYAGPFNPARQANPFPTQSFNAAPSPSTTTATPNQTQSFNAAPSPSTTTATPNQTQSFNAATSNSAPLAQDQPSVRTGQKTPVEIT